MPRTSKQTQSKSSADTKHVRDPELLAPDDKETLPSPGQKKVTVQRTERFIEPATPLEPYEDRGPRPAEPDKSESDDGWIDCPHCGGKFLESAFEANDEFCPGCRRDALGDLRESDDELQLSEAELLLSEIEDESEYKIRVERLPDYHVNGHTDSRATREFCTTLEPLSRDYLDRVQVEFGGGDYWFTVFRKGRAGFVRAWHKRIAAREPTVSAPSALVPQPSVGPSVDRLRLAVEKAVANRIEKILDDPPSTPTREGLPSADPVTEFEKQIKMMDQWTASMERLRGPASGGSDSLGVVALNILGGIIRDPSVTPLLAAGAQWLVAKAQGNGGPPAEVLALIEILVDQMTKNNDPLASAQETIKFFHKYPQFQSIIGQFANQSTTDVLINIAQLKPEFAHVRKLPHGPAWIARFKQLLTQPQGPPPPAVPAPEAPAATPPAPQPSPGELAFAHLLRRCAADMADSGPTDDDVCDESVAIARTIKLIAEFPEYKSQLTQVLNATPAMLVQYVAAQLQDATLLENPGSVLFARDYQTTLRAALNEQQESEVVSQESEPEAVATGATTADESVN